MFVPVKWLKEYVNINIDTKTFADKMTMSGSKVEEVKEVAKGIMGVVVGKILSITAHPNADKLVIVSIDVGKEKLQIVTGADNISEGDYVPVALHGAELADGLKIKKGKLRGEVSEGMLCSQEELGISKNLIPEELKDGIWILDQAYPIGSDIKEVLPLEDEVIEFEITSNRPDCLSMIGIAREAAATIDTKLLYPEVKINEVDNKAEDIATVSIEDEDGCPRYMARVIKDVKIEPSPLWMQQRLAKAGVRPINNIVDITNYVMLEYGQPLHAFDIDFVKDNHIIVRKAKNEEKITTLDGVERTLKNNMTVIADPDKALAIAGVMGGEESEVTNNTQTILLEAAYFNNDSVRQTSKELGLRSEASSRFEKGLDPNLVEVASKRACQLIEELGAGTILKGAVDQYPKVYETKKMTIRPTRINNLLGLNLTTEEMINILEKLEISAKTKENMIEVTVPSFRIDLDQEADFVEEIGRMYGFDNIPATMAKGNITVGGRTNEQTIEDYTKKILSNMGINEVLTYSFISPKGVDKIKLGENDIKRNFVKLINPLGDETSVMRTTILPNIMEVMERNYNRKVEAASAFEIGRVFIPQPDKKKKLPLELKRLVMGMYGEVDFFTIKGNVITLLERLGITNYKFEAEKYNPTYHPGRCANIILGEYNLGTIGEIHPVVAEEYGIGSRTYCAELDFELIIQFARLDVVYKQLPKYPAITRDFAVVLKDEIFVQSIEDIISKMGKGILENYKLFDVYKGDQVDQGYKSVAYTLTFRHKERTLKDDEVNKVYNKIIDSIKEELGGTLRE
ncbi:phenylalanine--tRNA ligase subunit beta [Serpentinicella sp. ANB-PHB4]|uniref:phenylalanine--tRNA ligase subunit beta n=1 Tax=Serpentinicella sp. ANB-PHB4 TaxID=3074076 RepID=UPI0028563996|nr:phenylalanine--tRNA ligase subunit beta [Serpentinicella sp. ANB-PHB4]MDR5659593.1 phenylalanine--tRNA ligase subunit beta [Serpentinicella sp. ANB-PHB4]